MAGTESSAKITISSLVGRTGDESLVSKIPDVNKIIKKFCNQNNWGFVDHKNISVNNHLNRSGLHLNRSGTSRLARNIINDLNLAAWESGKSANCAYTPRGKSLDPKISSRGLVMTSLNINSLLLHIDELSVFMSSSKIDILMINETKLDSTIHNNEVYITGFEIVRRDRIVNGRNGGGVCVYLRTNLNYRIRNDLSNDMLEQCLTIEITNPRSKEYD